MGHHPSRGSNIDDRAAASLAHRGHDRADPQIRAGQVDVDDQAPSGRLGPRDRAEAHNARAVDQHGDWAEGALGGGDRRRPVRLARDIEAGEDRACAEFVGERPPLLFEHVRDHDVRALGDEAARVAATHSADTAGDDHCSIVKTFHHWFSFAIAADDGWSAHATLIATSIFPRVALEYGHVWCAAFTKAWATPRSTPGKLTLRRARRKYSPSPSHKSTSASMPASVGRRVFILAAATPIAPRKQADQPAANNCSGLVPPPVVPGDESLMSKRPSELRDSPFRPPLLWALAVYSTFSVVRLMVQSS